MVSPEHLRLRVDAATYTGWVTSTPAVVVPPDFRPAAMRPLRLHRGDSPLPSGLAPALAVHAVADVTVTVRIVDGDLRIVTSVSTTHAIASSLARVGRLLPDGPFHDSFVEIALLPGEDAVDEVLRWVPAEPAPAAAAALAGEPAVLEVEVVAADDAVWTWREEWAGSGSRWTVREGGGLPGAGLTDTRDPEHLRASLTAVLDGRRTGRARPGRVRAR